MKILAFILGISIFGLAGSQDFEQVKINKPALDFSLKTIQGDEVKLSEIYNARPVVLVVLRGWPGYQCPVCTRQVGQLVGDKEKFSEQKAAVLMVYPGPSDELQAHAKEFSEDIKFPENFYFLLDPDYSMINKYGLRWDAPKETAYPSTFIISKEGKIVFSKVSTTHGGRASNEEIFDALGDLNSAK
jgi:peroxiredoxin